MKLSERKHWDKKIRKLREEHEKELCKKMNEGIECSAELVKENEDLDKENQKLKEQIKNIKKKAKELGFELDEAWK